MGLCLLWHPDRQCPQSNSGRAAPIRRRETPINPRQFGNSSERPRIDSVGSWNVLGLEDAHLCFTLQSHCGHTQVYWIVSRGRTFQRLQAGQLNIALNILLVSYLAAVVVVFGLRVATLIEDLRQRPNCTLVQLMQPGGLRPLHDDMQPAVVFDAWDRHSAPPAPMIPAAWEGCRMPS